MRRLFAGLDISTQSCKLVIIDYDAEEVVFVHSVNYDSDLPQYNTKDGVIRGLPRGTSEANPKIWVEAVDLVFEKLKRSSIPLDKILEVSVSGQQHGLVALDSAGRLSRTTSKLWNDFSTQEECEILTEKVGGLESMIEEVGNSQRTGYTAPKIFHMVRHEPDVYSRTSILFLVHNYINWYLTGGVSVMEPGDTSGMALWNPRNHQWSRKVIETIDPELYKKLPEVKSSFQSIGTISEQLVTRFGFSPECKIDAGSGDNMYGAIGTGNVEPGIVTVSLGTSGTTYSFMEQPFIDPLGEIAAFCDSTGHYLPLVCVTNLTNGYNEILKEYQLTHEGFNDLIEQTAPGLGGKLLIPWYMGERTPDVPQATPVYFGFGLNDFTPESLCRAVLEGHVLNLHNGFRLPVKVKEVRLTGGLSQSSAWCQAIADIFGAETVPVKGEGAALGAALHAAWVWLQENDVPLPITEVVEHFTVLDTARRKTPIEANLPIYGLQKRLFAALSQRIRGLEGEDPFELQTRLMELGQH